MQGRIFVTLSNIFFLLHISPPPFPIAQPSPFPAPGDVSQQSVKVACFPHAASRHTPRPVSS
ncbi:hypothetical protein E2C01_051706 [Portunus trituberculatus]|uniref:Secreted protein n=1 Tax=Portunus trituberculatus TaxID=210409 RepID=A0A5B7GJK0_PORTR|nr:hypothetical protein [Portunus trituberculatus]